MKGMASSLLTAFVISSLCKSNAEKPSADILALEVSDFVANVGWTTLKTVCSPQDKQCHQFSVKLLKQVHKVAQSTFHHETYGEYGQNYNTSLIIVLPAVFHQDLTAKSMTDLMKTASAYTALIISENDKWKSLIDVPLGFYFLDLHKHDIVKVIASRRAGDPQSFEFQEDSNLLDQNNMKGAYLHSVTMSYEPSIRVGECQPDQPCKEVSGFSYDLLQAVAIETNFTFSVYQEQSGIWGSVPREVNGKVYANATGIVKAVMDGQNDLPVCSWVPTHLRIPYVDFTFSYHEIMSRCFADVNQVQKMAYYLVIV